MPSFVMKLTGACVPSFFRLCARGKHIIDKFFNNGTIHVDLEWHVNTTIANGFREEKNEDQIWQDVLNVFDVECCLKEFVREKLPLVFKLENGSSCLECYEDAFDANQNSTTTILISVSKKDSNRFEDRIFFSVPVDQSMEIAFAEYRFIRVGFIEPEFFISPGEVPIDKSKTPRELGLENGSSIVCMSDCTASTETCTPDKVGGKKEGKKEGKKQGKKKGKNKNGGGRK